MAKNKLTLSVDEPTPAPSAKPDKTTKSKKSKPNDPNKPSIWKRIAKVFREMISELKKVDWPSFRRTKNNPGVLVNTGTVLVVVVFFLIVITLFDMGLTALFNLLTQV